MVKKMFIEFRLCHPMAYDFKGHVKIVEITVTKLFTILTKCFFPYLNPTSYLKLFFLRDQKVKNLNIERKELLR